MGAQPESAEGTLCTAMPQHHRASAVENFLACPQCGKDVEEVGIVICVPEDPTVSWTGLFYGFGHARTACTVKMKHMAWWPDSWSDEFAFALSLAVAPTAMSPQLLEPITEEHIPKEATSHDGAAEEKWTT